MLSVEGLLQFSRLETLDSWTKITKRKVFAEAFVVSPCLLSIVKRHNTTTWKWRKSSDGEFSTPRQLKLSTVIYFLWENLNTEKGGRKIDGLLFGNSLMGPRARLWNIQVLLLRWFHIWKEKALVWDTKKDFTILMKV